MKCEEEPKEENDKNRNKANMSSSKVLADQQVTIINNQISTPKGNFAIYYNSKTDTYECDKYEQEDPKVVLKSDENLD